MPRTLHEVRAEAVQDLLALVSVIAPIATVESWTDAQILETENWAMAVHLRASDNDDVEVPPEPEFVKQLERSKDYDFFKE